MANETNQGKAGAIIIPLTLFERMHTDLVRGHKKAVVTTTAG